MCVKYKDVVFVKSIKMYFERRTINPACLHNIHASHISVKKHKHWLSV